MCGLSCTNSPDCSDETPAGLVYEFVGMGATYHPERGVETLEGADENSLEMP